MLQAGADIFLLHAVYKGGADLSGEIRILGIIFEISSAERRTFHIDTRSEQDSNVLCLTFIAERIADATMKLLATKEVKEKLAQEGSMATPANGAQFGEWIRSEHAKWGKLIREGKFQIN